MQQHLNEARAGLLEGTGSTRCIPKQLSCVLQVGTMYGVRGAAISTYRTYDQWNH